MRHEELEPAKPVLGNAHHTTRATTNTASEAVTTTWLVTVKK